MIKLYGELITLFIGFVIGLSFIIRTASLKGEGDVLQYWGFLKTVYFSTVTILIVTIILLLLNQALIKQYNIRENKDVKLIGFLGILKIELNSKSLIFNLIIIIALFFCIPTMNLISVEYFINYIPICLLIGLLGGMIYLCLTLFSLFKFQTSDLQKEKGYYI